MTPELARRGFEAAVNAGALQLDLACAWMAAEESPGVEPGDLVEQLDSIADQIRAGGHDSPGAARPGAEIEQVARLAIGFGALGFGGDADRYDDPSHSLLDRVLSTRRGMPILLASILLEVARRKQIPLLGVGFPGHFLVATATDPPVILDPYHGCRVVPRPMLEAQLHQIDGRPPDRARLEAALAPVGVRYILARINNNLKGSWLRRGQVPPALRAVERLLLVAPDLADEVRDRGLMRLHMGEREGGLADLARYLEMAPEAADRERIAGRLRQG